MGAFGGYLLASIAVLGGRGGQNDRGSRRRVFGLWLLLWTPALLAIGWFIAHDEGFGAPPVPLALGSAASVGVALGDRRLPAGRTEDRGQGVGAADGQDQRDGVLAVRRLGDLLRRLRAARRQELVEKWVLSMNLSKTQFMLLSQVIIFVLGWPLGGPRSS